MTPHRFLVPILVMLGMVAATVASLGVPLLPSVAATDGVSLTAAQWSLTVTLLVGALAAPVIGRTGDGSRRRATILGAIGIVTTGCVLSALPLGFAPFIVGRALQGFGLGLVPVAMATARDVLPANESRSTIGLLAITTAAGIGLAYPVAGLITQVAGLEAAFWFGAVLGAGALALAYIVIPSSSSKARRPLDMVGTALLGLGLTGLLLVLGEGQSWGWLSGRSIGVVLASALILVGWVRWELRAPHPLVDVRLLGNRGVRRADLFIFMVGLGIYPLLSLVSRLVQTPASTGYGIGASVLIAGLALVPFSIGTFVAGRSTTAWLRTTSPDVASGLGCVVLIVAMITFLLARAALWEILITMGIAGLGVGCVFASNPSQVIAEVPGHETGSAMGFNQVARTVGFAAGSALSAAVLAIYTPAGRSLPTNTGYERAAEASLVILGLTLATSVAALVGRRRQVLSELG
ncbi:MAG: MFS transporter [Acidimicrobiales bacterium]